MSGGAGSVKDIVAQEAGQAFLTALRDQGFEGDVALQVQDLSGEVLCALNADEVYPAASTIKVPLLVLALQGAQDGHLSLDGRVILQAEDQVPGAGVLHELQPGLPLSWRDLLTLMIIVSDNTATNLVIGHLGTGAVNAWLDDLGVGDTRLVGRLQLPPGRQNEAQRRGERNRTTARDQVTLLGQLVRGELLDAAHTALAVDILGRQQYRDLLGRGLPHAPDGTPRYALLSKSGELAGVHHDVGVLYTPRPLVVALLSRGGEDLREHPENRDLGRLSRALWPLLARLGGDI